MCTTRAKIGVRSGQVDIWGHGEREAQVPGRQIKGTLLTGLRSVCSLALGLRSRKTQAWQVESTGVSTGVCRAA